MHVQFAATCDRDIDGQHEGPVKGSPALGCGSSLQVSHEKRYGNSGLEAERALTRRAISPGQHSGAKFFEVFRSDFLGQENDAISGGLIVYVLYIYIYTHT